MKEDTQSTERVGGGRLGVLLLRDRLRSLLSPSLWPSALPSLSSHCPIKGIVDRSSKYKNTRRTAPPLMSLCPSTVIMNAALALFSDSRSQSSTGNGKTRITTHGQDPCHFRVKYVSRRFEPHGGVVVLVVVLGAVQHD